jgi:hypothetical protein
MGVWDMRYLVREYRKALVNADNPVFTSETRDEFSQRAEDLRLQMARYLERVENESKANNLDKRQ